MMTLTLSATGLAAHLGFGTWKLSYRSKSFGRKVYDSHLDPEGVGIWRPQYYSNGRFRCYEIGHEMKPPSRARLSLRRLADDRFRPAPVMSYVRREEPLCAHGIGPEYLCTKCGTRGTELPPEAFR